MATLDVYLKIETIPGYSPVEPDDHVSPPIQYRRDCMRNMGHEDGTVPDDEVAARRLTALIYREYLDTEYLVPKPDKLVAADVNEPAFTRRVPGTVIYARPGDWLRIHVKNGDVAPHSFHLHGVRYGIDSDGSWPFGTQSDDGRRSVEMPMGIMAMPGHGLDLSDIPPKLVPYLVTLDELAHAPQPQPPNKHLLHVPLFFHQMSGARGTPVFQSAPLNVGGSYTSPTF